MASILDVSVSSDSEDDADYIPTGDVAPSDSSGEEDVSSDEIEAPNPKRLKTKKSLESKKEVEKPKVTNGNDRKELNGDSKNHASDVWKSFLSEVEATSDTKPSLGASVDLKEIVCAHHSPSASIPVESASTLKEPAASVFEFAGETFTVKHDCKPASSLEKPKVASSTATSEAQGAQSLPKKRGGIDSVLGTLLNKKQKMTTLQKTLYDWKTFKKDEGIEEDLEKFNKGRGGFIERQRFLQRSDVRSFEVEKGVRQSKKKN